MSTNHVITIKFHISTDVDPQAEGGLEKYLQDVGQAIIDGIPKDWFEPTEEYLYITGADIQTGTPFFQEGTRGEIAQYLTAYVAHELSARPRTEVMGFLQHWLEQGLEAFEEGAR